MTDATDQVWDPGRYSENARFVSDLGTPVVELLAPRRGERVLDLGCGDGVLTRKLLELGCDVVGVDRSPAMVAAARAAGVDARVEDGEAIAFEREFDAVFSNAALHWMRRPERVIAGVFRALRPGGRFVGECGGQGCAAAVVAAIESGLRARGIDPRSANPWYFPAAEEYRAKLETGGFAVEHIALFPRPTPLPGALIGWLETFAQSFTAKLPAAERAAFLEEVQDGCRSVLLDANGTWSVDYVRLRFSARRPAPQVA